MNNFINNLNSREKKLILLAVIVISIGLIFFLMTNMNKEYNLSKKKLLKAKYDYEYVSSKAMLLEESLKNSKIEVSEIRTLIENNENDINALDIKIIEKENSVNLSFVTSDLKSSIFLSNEISSKLNMDLISINFSRNGTQSQTILAFN
tara:strand:+ start:9319 stop:9765 length:447 start_codon:yes stop_codon:yes gene_type:complete